MAAIVLYGRAVAVSCQKSGPRSLTDEHLNFMDFLSVLLSMFAGCINTTTRKNSQRNIYYILAIIRNY